MAIFDNFPYTNFHELNADWIIDVVKNVDQSQKDIDSNISEMFNQTTQKALSSSIINLLMQNDTFLNMQESVKRISSRE